MNTRYVLKNIVLAFKSGFVPLCVWGMFSSKGRSPLLRISGTLNQHRYRQILKDYVIPFKNQLHAAPMNFIYQHDGCDPPSCEKRMWISRSIKYWSTIVGSADPRPKSHWTRLGWDEADSKDLDTYLTAADSLFLKLTNIWSTLSDEYFKNLIASMGSRCSAI